LITFPLLVWLGVPPLTANVSNTVGLVPASVTGAWGYRRELRGVWGVVARMAVLSAVGGVAGGVALRLGIDPLITRGVLAVSVLFGGLGLVLYAIGWLLLPEQRD
ncbi:TSUP family transporter, partial [Streptococcus pyogenes]|uniref:PspC domain-containing protein n=1 Tax=Streptococcus pyogenes TaxID=1314 RepID=UPI003DA10817